MIYRSAQSRSAEPVEPEIFPVAIDYSKAVNVRNAGFPKVLVKRHTNRGTPYWREEAYGVPKIPASFLDGVFYLYSDRVSAEGGAKYGGTGFFVGVPCVGRPGAHFIYAVSNWHVAVQGGFSVLRVNSKDGPPEIIELGPENWEFDPQSGHDIAVALVPMDLGPNCKFSFLPSDGFVTPERFHATSKTPLGVGEDVFMVGRFVDHDGGPTNQPSARFGHISIGPSKLPGIFGKDVDMVCLDTNSRTGFSGSPVYVYRTATSDLEQLFDPEIVGKLMVHQSPMLMLLGVHTGQFPEWWTAEAEAAKAEAEAGGMEEASLGRVRGLSGMTRVAPAWGIAEIIDGPKFKGQREAVERYLAEQMNTGVAITGSGEDGAA